MTNRCGTTTAEALAGTTPSLTPLSSGAISDLKACPVTAVANFVPEGRYHSGAAQKGQAASLQGRRGKG